MNCSICDEDIQDGQPIHGFKRAHWECVPEQSDADVDADIKAWCTGLVGRVDDSIERLKATIANYDEE